MNSQSDGAPSDQEATPVPVDVADPGDLQHEPNTAEIPLGHALGATPVAAGGPLTVGGVTHAVAPSFSRPTSPPR